MFKNISKLILAGMAALLVFASGCGKNSPVVVEASDGPTGNAPPTTQATPADYTVPSIPLAENQLPRIAETIYEMEITHAGQHNYIRPLISFEDGEQVLLAYNTYTDTVSEAMVVDQAELLLVDKEYHVLQTKALSAKKYASAGTSALPGKGCFSLDDTINLVDQSLNVESLEVKGLAALYSPHAIQEDAFLVQDGYGPLYQVAEGQATKIMDGEEDILVNDYLNIIYAPGDAPDQFRVYTPKEIWRMDPSGKKEVLFDDLNDSAPANWPQHGFRNKLKMSSDGRFAYVELSATDTNDTASCGRISEKDFNGRGTAVYGLPVLLQYRVEADGKLCFEKELFYYQSSYLVFPLQARYVEDANGNGYLAQDVPNETEEHIRELRKIGQDGVSQDAVIRYSLVYDKLEKGYLAEAKEKVLLGTLRLDGNQTVITLLNNLKEEERGPVPRDAIVRLDFSSQPTDQKLITAYTLKNQDGFPEIAHAFEEQHPEYKVEITAFDKTDDLRQVLMTELLAGKGPDIIFCNPMPFLNPEKTMQNGYLLDLAPYIDQNSDFSMADYFPQAINPGMVDGKRYIAPLDFTFWPTYTTAGMLDKLELSAGDALPAAMLMDLAKKQTAPLIYTNLSYNVDHYSQEYEILYRYWQNMGVAMVDQLGEKALFDQPAFQKAMVFLKDLYQSQGALMRDAAGQAKGNDDGLMWDPSIPFSGFDLFRWEKAMESKGEKGVLLAPPSVEGTVPSGIIFDALAVNANAQEKNGAIQFVQFALGEDMQAQLCFNWNLVPVNKKAFENQIQHFMSQKADESTIITEEYIAPYRKLIEQSGPCQLRDMELEKMVDEAVVRYLKDEISLDQLTKSLMQKVGIYLKE